MSNINQVLLLVFLDIIWTIETADDETIQPDFAVELMENTSAALLDCSEKERDDLSREINEIAARETDPERKSFYEELPDALGLR